MFLVPSRRLNFIADKQNDTTNSASNLSPSASWESGSLTTAGDVSGNLVEEVGALGENNDGTISIQLKDYDHKSVSGTIYP